MSLVKVTANLRNGKAYAKDMLINLERITEPVIENLGGEAIVSLSETPQLQNGVNQGNNKVQYVLDESLAVFTALANKEMFTGTVVLRDSRTPVVSSQTFIVKNVVGKIVEDTLGCKFLYEEEGGLVPVEYILSETIAAIAILIA